MTQLHVLLWMPRASEIPGGHRVQFEQTARALGDLGISARVWLEAEPPPDEVDVVHGFGLTAAEVHELRQRHLPVALSTIYGDRAYRTAYGGASPGLRELPRRVGRAARYARSAFGPRDRHLERILRDAAGEVALVATYSSADVLLPNSVGEARSLSRELGIVTRTVVVPNAVDPDSFHDVDSGPEGRDSVLCVGRIEPHKNQLGLIEALRGSGYRLVIAGPAHPHHPEYHERCVAAGGGSVEFIGDVPHDELGPVYARARVHVLPTWFETTGLVSLEAALCGCAIVSTSRGHANEYFGDLAHYCDPADPGSIRRAVDEAFRVGPRPELRERILQNYTWRHTAEATAAAYASIRR